MLRELTNLTCEMLEDIKLDIYDNDFYQKYKFITHRRYGSLGVQKIYGPSNFLITLGALFREMRHGKWIFYDMNGRIRNVDRYKRDQLVSQTKYSFVDGENVRVSKTTASYHYTYNNGKTKKVKRFRTCGK